MSPPTLEVTTKWPRDPRLFVRDHGRFLRESLHDAMAVHHRRHIPWHFEPFAAAKYGYVKRRARYQARKDKLGLPPLVSPNPATSGQLRTAMTQFRQITATQTRSRLLLRLPFTGGTGRLKKIGGGGLTSSQQNVMARIAEMEVIATDERDYLTNFIGVNYAHLANQPGTPYRVRNTKGTP
jgi:hypothetical protein